MIFGTRHGSRAGMSSLMDEFVKLAKSQRASIDTNR